MGPGEIKISKTILLEREFPNLGQLSKGTLTTTPLEQSNAITKDAGTALN